MIVMGYQGIGKSTLARKNLRYVDLESSYFRFSGLDNCRVHSNNEKKENLVNGILDLVAEFEKENLYEVYCNVAENLSRQGYTVFVSSHQPVRERLLKSEEYVIVCVPTLNLKDKWIERLRLRYENSGLEKDYKAYMNAKDCFTENVNEIMRSGFDVLEIEDMDYDLKKLLEVCDRERFTKEEVKQHIDDLKNWDNYKPFHDAVDLVEKLVERMDV